VSATKESDGKISQCTVFDAKAAVESYIRTLPIKSAFFAPATFMQNIQNEMKPRKQDDGTYTMAHVWNPTSAIPFIDVLGDSGKFVCAALAEPDKFDGKFIAAATTIYTPEEVVDTISKATGQTVKYKQIPDEVFKGFLPPSLAQPLLEMFRFEREYGYFGRDQKEAVEWAASNARGKLATLEEYLKANPLDL